MSSRRFPGADDEQFPGLACGSTRDRVGRRDAAKRGYVCLRSAPAVVVAWAIIVPASADSGSSSFIVGATVVAGCNIIVPPTVSRSYAAERASNNLCLPPDAAFPVAAPQPSVRITRDGATGVETVTVEF